MTVVSQQSLNELQEKWLALKAENPKLRIRNAADTLGASELELVLTGLGQSVMRLNNQHGELLQALEGLGSVMALSRNDQVVHEKHGVYTNFKIAGKGQMGICLGDIDLRVFFSHWKTALAVTEAGQNDSVRRSIQFFDATGSAVHKIYCTADTNETKWTALIDQFTADEQTPDLELTQIPEEAFPNTGKVSTEAVRNEWQALKDVHHFHAMLKRLGVSRLEALDLVGEDYALKLPLQKAEEALTLAQAQQVPIMVFVGNRGIVQIHTGTINKLLRTGPWFNVLDPGFNLHFDTETISQVWRVKRPTAEGIVTSLEIYNAKDELVLTLFGERKPSLEERSDWRDLVSELESEA